MMTARMIPASARTSALVMGSGFNQEYAMLQSITPTPDHITPEREKSQIFGAAGFHFWKAFVCLLIEYESYHLLSGIGMSTRWLYNCNCFPAKDWVCGMIRIVGEKAHL